MLSDVVGPDIWKIRPIHHSNEQLPCGSADDLTQSNLCNLSHTHSL